VKKLDSYLVREMIVPFLIGTIAVVLMFQANTYIFLAKTLNLENVPAKAVFQYILYQTPTYLNMTLAVGMSLGSSLAISRIARESELTAIRAAGVRILRALAPIVLFGCVVGVGNYYLAERIMPPATKKATQLGFQIGATGMTPNLKANAIVSLQNYTVMVGTIRRKGAHEMDLQNVLLLEQPQANVTQITKSLKGRYKDGVWTFGETYVWRFDGVNLVPSVLAAKGRVMTINERIATEGLFAPPMPTEQTAEELRENIALKKKSGVDTKGDEVNLHVRYAVPSACVVFAIVGPVFAIVFARSGGFVGVFLSIILVLLYYNAFVISTEILSKIDAVPAWGAAWLPNILFALLGVVAIRRLE